MDGGINNHATKTLGSSPRDDTAYLSVDLMAGIRVVAAGLGALSALIERLVDAHDGKRHILARQHANEEA